MANGKNSVSSPNEIPVCNSWNESVYSLLSISSGFSGFAGACQCDKAFRFLSDQPIHKPGVKEHGQKAKESASRFSINEHLQVFSATGPTEPKGYPCRIETPQARKQAFNQLPIPSQPHTALLDLPTIYRSPLAPV